MTNQPRPELVEKVARAICQSVIDGRVLGGTHTVWTDWRPEAIAAIRAVAAQAETDQ